MKPLKLTMTAFGPYKQTEVIDFQNLQENRLFVISGNTGAGKTTIFDGISFALYGSASGQDRENNTMLRSDFAADDTHTSVELEFELRGRFYRVLRQLGHVKAGNKSKTGERYEFFEQTASGEIPCVDRQIVSEIDQKIEELIGLTQDQFKQIVMLPQGEFRKLLTSQTENKEEILRRLFKTQPYKHISDRLRVKKNTVEEQYKQAKQTRDQYIQNIQATLPYREDSLVFQVLSEDYYNENQVITGLEEEINFYKTQISVDEQKYHEAYKAHDKKQTELHQAKAINDRFNELNQKNLRLKELDEKVPAYNEKEKQLELAERASNLEPYEKQAAEWRADEKAKNKNLANVERVKTETDKTVETTQSAFKQEENKQTEREEIRKELERLQGFLPVVKEIETKKQTLKTLKQREKHYHHTLTTLQNERKENKIKAEECNKQIKELDEAVGLLPDKQQQLMEMREQARILIDYTNLRDQQAKQEKEVQQRKAAFEEIKAAHTKLEQTWLNNQASMLASHLHDGVACPVCGSHEHPFKATAGDDGVSKEALEASKKKLDEKDGAYRDASASLKTVTEQVKEKEKETANYSIQADDAVDERDRLIGKGKQLKEEVSSLKTKQEKLTALKKENEKRNEKIKQLEEDAEKNQQIYQQVKSDYDKERAGYEKEIANIPEEVQVLSVLENKITETEKTKTQMDKAWEEVQTKLQQAKEAQTKADANLAHATKQAKETAEKRKKSEQQFTEALSNADFASEQDYQKAKMDQTDRRELKKAIEQFKQNRLTLHEQVNELKESLKDQKQVDLTQMQTQLNQLKVVYENALKKWNQSEEYYQEATALRTKIKDENDRVRDLERQFGTVSDLYDVIRGQNNRKISFERYLQIEYLEQIIDAANHRLRNLSNGQFFLMRSDRQESHGRQSGLALDVYDAYTGQTRDVKSLSGGEKFNASLCLALGMSDVIQHFQGNISIETMFIDEGFGTLDEEALHKAIDTLVDLQQSGRMIGVISHVQELKSIFPAVLEVKKTKEGASQTKFVVS